MTTKIKKEDFDKYSIKGFKIGDTIWIQEADIQAEIMAVDLDESCMYNIMIDARKINLKAEDFIGIPMKDCNSDSVYYRGKALKKKYKIWVNLSSVEHVCVTHTRENSLDDKQECFNVENDSAEDLDDFMIEDYLKEGSETYSEFYLKSKYDNIVLEDQYWNNESYTDDEALVEVNYDEAEYVAIVFDSNNSENYQPLLEAVIEYAEGKSEIPQSVKTIIDSICFYYCKTCVKKLVESIIKDLYTENIIRSFKWDDHGMCAVLVKVQHD